MVRDVPMGRGNLVEPPVGRTEQAGKDTRTVEPGEARPVDRPVAGDERPGPFVPDESVVVERQFRGSNAVGRGARRSLGGRSTANRWSRGRIGWTGHIRPLHRRGEVVSRRILPRRKP